MTRKPRRFLPLAVLAVLLLAAVVAVLAAPLPPGTVPIPINPAQVMAAYYQQQANFINLGLRIAGIPVTVTAADVQKAHLEHIRREQQEQQIKENTAAVWSAFQSYQSLASLTNLFVDEDDLAEERAEANELFCKTIIAGGTQCWASKICEHEIKAKPGDGIMVGREAIGPEGFPLALPVAHVQAERSLPIQSVDEQGNTFSQWIYRFTFYLKNTLQDSINYNVIFLASDGTSYRWFPQDQTVGGGAIAAMTGSAGPVAYSRRNYVKICLDFDDLPAYDGKEVGQVCNVITEYAGGATSPYAPPAPAGNATGTGGSGGSSAGPQPGDGF